MNVANLQQACARAPAPLNCAAEIQSSSACDPQPEDLLEYLTQLQDQTRNLPGIKLLACFQRLHLLKAIMDTSPSMISYLFPSSGNAM